MAVLAQAMRKDSPARGSFIDLTESNPTRCGFSAVGAEILKPLSDPANLSYEPDPRGSLTAREAVCRYYAEKNIVISPDQVVLTASTSEAYSFVFKLLLDPSDRIALLAPSYPLLDSLLALCDSASLRYRLRYEGGWRIDAASLEDAFSQGCKALCVINPNNPTGNFVQKNDKDFLNRLSLRHGASIVSDEVFFDFSLDPHAVPASFAGNKYCLTFTLSGISKILGLPQMKLSWIVVSGPEAELREALRRLEIIADTFLSVNTPSQTALGAWLKHGPETRREISLRTAANYEFLRKTLADRSDLKVLSTEGGWVAVIRAYLQMDDEELSLKLLETAGVLVHPGYLYDFEEGNHLVLSLLLPPDRFKEAVLRIKGFGS